MRLHRLIVHGILFALLGGTLLPNPVRAADEDKDKKPEAESSSSDSKEKKSDKKKKEEKFKPYDEVVTEDFKTDAGLFFVHRNGNKVLFEIPQESLGLPMLWVTQIAKTEAGHSYGGSPIGDRIVRWEQNGDDILLREVDYALRAEGEGGIETSVASTSLEPILGRFPIKAWGKDRAPVIDVADFYAGDIPEFSAKSAVGGASADRGRSFIDSIKSFPRNIETQVYITYKLSGDNGVVTVLLHHSMVRLPEEPMHPRRFDDRVGFFSVGFQSYGSPEHEVKDVRYITRWRLEKKDPDAELSEPKQPIVFYVGRDVPDKWRPSVKKGIEAWQPIFEAAGFKKAIVAKDAPTVREDPDWDAEDARYSVIRWLPATIENAFGPHVHDPRSGEIIEADIRIYHNVLKLARDWYYVQASPMDPRAQKFPFPDDLMGEVLAYVVSHEVGHSLGLQHNMKASSAYTVDQLRDPEFTKKNGTEASIMDYGRFNYVSQPGDDARLIPIIGPYDRFAIEWGYKPFPGRSEEEERNALKEIAARQLDHPELRFESGNAHEDPTAQTEDLGSEPVAATELGLKNIFRIATNLVEQTCREGRNYDLLENMYGQLIGQWGRELGHVANEVGGVEFNNLWFGQADHRYSLIPPKRQKGAVKFLNQHAFQVPPELVDTNILLRLESSGAAQRMLDVQQGLLRSLLRTDRIRRMSEWSLRRPGQSYAPWDFLEDVRNGIWSELDQEKTKIDLYRRNLQRAHLDILINLAKQDATSSDLPALARGQLDLIERSIAKAKETTEDVPTKMHLDQSAARIDRTLHPRDSSE